jgi:hypothetical protein
VLDRASVFADDEIVSLLRTRFVPVAVDEWYHVRRQDPEGEFYRKVVFQRAGMQAGRTTQGFYLFDAEGTLIQGWNNRDTAKVKRNLQEALQRPLPRTAAKDEPAEDRRLARRPPEGGLVVDVHSRIVKAAWTPAKNEWDEILRAATGRDRLWISSSEAASLAAGAMPESLARRIARFHLVDNTRGEPPMWSRAEVRELKIGLAPDKRGYRLEGRVRLATDSGDRGYEAALLGSVEIKEGRVARFDVVARGEFWGEGTYTRGAPPGRFTLAVAFRIAGDGEASKVPPQGARDLGDYMRE